MIRRISIVTLVLALVSITVPRAAFAGDDTPNASTRQLARVAAALSTPHVLNLQDAGRGVVPARETAKQQSGGFLSTGRGKATLAAAILVAAVFVCYAAAQGPDPTPATQK